MMTDELIKKYKKDVKKDLSKEERKEFIYISPSDVCVTGETTSVITMITILVSCLLKQGVKKRDLLKTIILAKKVDDYYNVEGEE